MAWEHPATLKVPGLVAGADLSAKQYHFVEVTGAGTVNVCDATTDCPIGVLQNAPKSGEECEIVCIGITKMVADAAVTVNAPLGTSADGQAAVYAFGTDTTKYLVGRALTACSNAGEIVTVLVNCASPARGS